MSEFESGADLRQARIAHLYTVANYLNMAMMAIWGRSERAPAMLGMFDAGIRYSGPDGHDEDLLAQLRNLFAEAKEFREAEQFPPMMARLRVAYDLVTLRIIEVSGE